MQVGKICLNKGFLEVLKPENKQKKSTVSVQSVENADNLTRQEEQKEENTNLDILKNLKKNKKSRTVVNIFRNGALTSHAGACVAFFFKPTRKASVELTPFSLTRGENLL